MTTRLTRFLNTAAMALLTAGILAGCANTPTDLQPGAAAKLQTRLQSLSRDAADNNLPAAKAELDLFTSEFSTAAANGEISPTRRQDIQNAIDLIRADLAAMTTTPAPAPTPSPTAQTPTPVAPQPPAKGKAKGKDD
ncbi:hypothetical protein [Arthrobacter sp. FW306-07-I]|uniref:hypothetical protein n=1 Tax=Arthrobacter sp. FW306-07-I TaxID=2879622 RepID=UPI001F361ECF|nr:hypothetical protein [Arthrobacter sp. FW306-07-I]UKA76150.1 hypothetical protein LFT46_03570 [Arthrobacter sp. FW306-07-I]